MRLAARMRSAAAGVGGGATVEEVFPGFVADGVPISWPESPSSFTISNYTTGTDGGEPALTLTDPFSAGSILTTSSTIEHAIVSVRFRAQPGAGLNIANINLRPVGRRSDSSNFWRLERSFAAPGASWLLPVEKIAGFDGSGSALGGEANLDCTNTTTDQWIVMQVFHDVLRGKTWFTNVGEPATSLGSLRFRPIDGSGGTTTSSDDNTPDAGKWGVTADYGGTIKQVIVQPLARTDANLFLNAAVDPDLLTSGGLPFFWARDGAYTNQADKGICNTVSAVLPDGTTGLALRVARDTDGSEGGGPMWQAGQYVTNAADSVAYTRNRPIPTVGAAFPATIGWEIWTKGTGVVDTGPPSIPPCAWVNYYDDASGTGLNLGHSDYYWTIAPDGLGTWGWTKFTGTFTVHGAASAIRNQVSIGFHNDTTTGLMLMSKPRFFAP